MGYPTAAQTRTTTGPEQPNDSQQPTFPTPSLGPLAPSPLPGCSLSGSRRNLQRFARSLGVEDQAENSLDIPEHAERSSTGARALAE
jgi:hypothetical protein